MKKLQKNFEMIIKHMSLYHIWNMSRMKNIDGSNINMHDNPYGKELLKCYV